MDGTPPPDAGDVILNRFTAELSLEEREEAREKLRAYARWLLQIAMSQVSAQINGDDSRSETVGDKVEELKPVP